MPTRKHKGGQKAHDLNRSTVSLAIVSTEKSLPVHKASILNNLIRTPSKYSVNFPGKISSFGETIQLAKENEFLSSVPNWEKPVLRLTHRENQICNLCYKTELDAALTAMYKDLKENEEEEERINYISKSQHASPPLTDDSSNSALKVNTNERPIKATMSRQEVNKTTRWNEGISFNNNDFHDDKETIIDINSRQLPPSTSEVINTGTDVHGTISSIANQGNKED